MSITKKLFGKLSDGTEVYRYTLKNKNGMTAEILNFGGILQSLVFDETDVVLTHKTAKDYTNNPAYLGAIVGRNSNRIEKAEFELNGKVYKLSG